MKTKNVPQWIHDIVEGTYVPKKVSLKDGFTNHEKSRMPKKVKELLSPLRGVPVSN